MPKRRRPSVEKYHDRVAPRYDHSYEDGYWKWHDAITWDHIKQFLPTDQRSPVLDLGCGTGKWAEKLSRSGFTVTCVDISSAMVDQARRKLGKLREIGDTRASYVKADLCDLSELPRGEFGLAVAMGDPIGCTIAPAKAMKEIRSVLAPGAALVATFDNRLNALDYYLQKGDPAEMEGFLRQGRTRWITRDHEEQFPIYTYTPKQVRALCEAAGFRVVDLIGKTVLNIRQFRHLVEESADRRAWMKIEKSLHRDEPGIGRCAHLQVAAMVD